VGSNSRKTGCPSPVSRPAKTIDIGIVSGRATRDAAHRSHPRCDPIRLVDSSRPPVRDACPAPPIGILKRSNRRFRQSDRLLWLILRRVWPRWRDPLVLVRPATVDRWHRDQCIRRWWRHSRRPGRPRIDVLCRDLIGRLAEENRLWGAPRIHGELLKLGVVVSERTVSRYLQDRPQRTSQTWRTFIANHVGQFEFNTRMPSPDVSGDDLVDASPSTYHPGSSDWLRGSRPCALLSGRVSVPTPGLDSPCTQDHCRARTGMRWSAGRAPTRSGLQRTDGVGVVKVDSFRSHRANGNC